MLLNCKVYDHPKESEPSLKLPLKFLLGKHSTGNETQIEGCGILGKAKKNVTHSFMSNRDKI